MMGSVAYGVSSDTSDMDIYGFCIPPKEIIFPHTAGVVFGFDNKYQKFEQFQAHHIESKDDLSGKGRIYDLNIYSIVKYFRLCADNNPNMIDSLFTPQDCVLHQTKIGQMVRENRRLFLHKGYLHKTKGYAFSQINKGDISKKYYISDMRDFEESHGIPHSTKFNEIDTLGLDSNVLSAYNGLWANGFDNTKRFENQKIHNQCNKFLYHVVRLVGQAEEVLLTHDLDLRTESRREHMKAVRRGEVSFADIKAWFTEKERDLERLYQESKLQHSPPEQQLKSLLLNCLEEHYGSLDKCIVNLDKHTIAINKIKEILETI